MSNLKWQHCFLVVLIIAFIVVVGSYSAGNGFVMTIAFWVATFDSVLMGLAFLFDV